MPRRSIPVAWEEDAAISDNDRAINHVLKADGQEHEFADSEKTPGKRLEPDNSTEFAAAASSASLDPAPEEHGDDQPLDHVEVKLLQSYSMKSTKALRNLDDFEKQYVLLEHRVQSIEKEIAYTEYVRSKTQTESEHLGILKNELAQMNGKVEKLQLEGIDSVLIGHLKSGQEEARNFRKSLNVRIDQLVARINSAYQLIEEVRNASSSNTEEVVSI